MATPKNTTTKATATETAATANGGNTTTYTVATYILERLRQCGLGHVFAVPGDYASPFLDALDADDSLVRVPNICELGSGYAADGYGRYKGIGAACVQYGVGTFSLLNCTAGSYVERVPVVVISASPSASDRQLTRNEGILFHHSTGDLAADQLVFENVTVAAEVIGDPRTAPEQIDSAIVAMLTHQRPIYLEVWKNVWAEKCAPPKGILKPIPLVSDPESLNAALDAAMERIAKARLPVLWADAEIQRMGLQDTLQALVDASGFYYTTTSLGKTVLNEAQRQFIGTYAGPASPALTRAVMAAADCIIGLGTITTDDYLDIMAQVQNPKVLQPADFGNMIEANDQIARVGYGYYHEVYFKDFLEGLLARVKADKRFPRKYSTPRYVPDKPLKAKASDPIRYQSFYEEVSAYLLANVPLDQTTLILGESTSLYVFGNMMGLPQNGFVAQADWGSLGHETGCALGVALGSGRRPWVVAGDGGFRMICQELSSLAMQKVNAVVFVISNDSYTIEQAFVDLKAFTPTGKFAPFDLLPVWDYVALAKAFGAKGYKVTTIKELRKVLPEVNAVQGMPTLIQVVIPQKDIPDQLLRLASTP